ncbi:MAG: hypothetical protein KC910_18375 [Candidatus Eremiobacteraeota bacterium]|nr:hypothetical protein [Candidatus Eremiobacteraeota bacterium]
MEQTIGHELLVYDSATGRAHDLDQRAAEIFKLCDGGHTWEAIAEQLPAANLEVVARTLRKLADLGLIVKGPEKTSRRGFLGKAVLTALPVIASVSLPRPAAAASAACNAATACNTCSGATCGDACDGCTGARNCFSQFSLDGIASGSAGCFSNAGVDPSCVNTSGSLDCADAKLACCNDAALFCTGYACCGTTDCVCPPTSINLAANAFNQLCGNPGTNGRLCCDGSGTCNQATSSCV